MRESVSRRHVLGLVAAGGAVLAAGGAGLALRGTVLREPRRPLRALDSTGFSVMAAVADCVCPAAEGLPSAWDLQVPEAVDALLAAQAPGTGDEVAQVLFLLENAALGLVLDGRPRPFTACAADEQLSVLAGWQRSRVPLKRTAAKALRALACGPYWASPEVFAHVGYPGPPRFAARGAP